QDRDREDPEPPDQERDDGERPAVGEEPALHERRDQGHERDERAELPERDRPARQRTRPRGGYRGSEQEQPEPEAAGDDDVGPDVEDGAVENQVAGLRGVEDPTLEDRTATGDERQAGDGAAERRARQARVVTARLQIPRDRGREPDEEHGGQRDQEEGREQVTPLVDEVLRDLL